MDYFKASPLVGVITLFFVASQPAYAYLDPGTGSIIIQSVIGGIAAAATFGAIYWSRLKVFLLRCFSKKTSDNETSEGRNNN